MTRRLVLWSCLVLAACWFGFGTAVAAPAETRQESRDDEEALRLARLRAWAAAVREHEPGTFDEPARILNRWLSGDLQAAVTDLRALARFLAASKQTSQKPGARPTTTYRERTVSISDVQDVLGLTDDEVARGDANDLIKRGALLHADMAMLAPPEDRLAVRSPSDWSGEVVYLYSDGRPRGFEFAGVHWTIGRRLLDEVRPDPSLDETVRLWYRAMGSYLQARHAFAYAQPLLEDGRRIFPRDAEIALYSGAVHESYATSRVQAWAGPNESGSFSAAIRSRSRELEQAQSLFRLALKINPGLTEARLRLGRVLELLGHAQEASTHLRQAGVEAEDPMMRYFAHLFLGQAEEALGHRDAARDAFGRAAGLFPGAQSARLALSQLARSDGDRAGALGVLREVLSISGDDVRRDDPWWVYHDTHVPDADAWLEKLREPFLSEEQP